MILHNMIVDDKWDNYELAFDYEVVEGIASESIVKQ